MQYPLLSEYLSAVTNASDNLDKLKHLVVVPDQYGEPYRSSGAFAVVFKMQDPTTGKYYALKCFTEEQPGRAEAYRKICEELEYIGSRYFPSMSYYERELFVDSQVSEVTEFPVLLMDWVEGETMELYISKHYKDSYRMGMLCHNFCRLASWLRSQPFAHGDIKPDNIIVDERGSLTLIDCDGMYVPSMRGEQSPTMGTQDFRHPLRTPQHFDDTIDDFTLATIALSLRAITLEPTLLDRYGAADRLLFSASDFLDLSQSTVLRALWDLTRDRDLVKLLSLFLLAHAEQSLTATAFHLFSAARPEKPEPVELLSTAVTEEDLKNAYTDSYGVKLSPDGKRLLKAPSGLVHNTVPDSVKVICDRAFFRCNSLTDITLPTSLTSIGDWAFDECSSLSSLTLPASLTSIGEWAFRWCSSLTAITLPASLTSIEGNPFAGLKLKLHSASPHFYIEDDVLFTRDKTKLIACLSDKTAYQVPESVTSIGDWAFSWCESLTAITLPASLTSIGEEAFLYCYSLTAITLPEGLTSIGDNAFYYCSSLTDITLPASLTSIGEWAFLCCSLTSLTLPASLTSIGEGAFSYCSDLSSLTLPASLTSIGDSAFYDCSSLSSLTLPASLTSIGDRAFYDCSSLSSLTLPTSLMSIGEEAFSGCSSLTAITLPEGLTSIGRNPFLGLKLKLQNKSLYFYVEDDVLFTADKTTLLAYCSGKTAYCVPESVTSIGDWAFKGCSSLSSLTLPASLTSIGKWAFSGCSSLSYLTLPASLTSIGYRAFYECSSLAPSVKEELRQRFGNNAF